MTSHEKEGAEFPPYPLRGWEQIEDDVGISAAAEEIRSATRFAIYTRADLYESAYPGYPGDHKFYRERTREGNCLYLGIGSGRIFGAIAEQNPHAVGIDNSPEMLDLLRRNHPHVKEEQIMLADAASEAIADESMDTIVAPYSFLMVIPREGLHAVLTNIRRMLKPGGRFYTDTFNPYWIPHRPGYETAKFTVGHDTSTQMYISYNHDKQTMREETVFREKDGNKLTVMDLYYYYPNEILDAFAKAGLKPAGITIDYTETRFQETNDVDRQGPDVLVYTAERENC